MGSHRHTKVLIAVAVGLWLPSAAHADDPCPGADTCTVSTDGNSVVAEGEHDVAGASTGGTAGGPTIITTTDLVGDGLDSICVTTAMEQGRDPFQFCGLTEDGEPPELTPGMIAVAFKTIPLPPANLIIQPPNGRTLVNFETNFYTDAQPFPASVALLGHEIEFQIRPATFAWRFGDGATRATSEPGAAYPDLQITHRYLAKGQVGPSLDTTYAATYRVDGRGPWREVNGTVTVAGTPVSLEVLTATPVLVGYDG